MEGAHRTFGPTARHLAGAYGWAVIALGALVLIGLLGRAARPGADHARVDRRPARGDRRQRPRRPGAERPARPQRALVPRRHRELDRGDHLRRPGGADHLPEPGRGADVRLRPAAEARRAPDQDPDAGALPRRPRGGHAALPRDRRAPADRRDGRAGRAAPRRRGVPALALARRLAGRRAHLLHRHDPRHQQARRRRPGAARARRDRRRHRRCRDRLGPRRDRDELEPRRRAHLRLRRARR